MSLAMTIATKRLFVISWVATACLCSLLQNCASIWFIVFEASQPAHGSSLSAWFQWFSTEPPTRTHTSLPMAVVLAIAILVVNLGILWCLQWMPRKDRQSANQTTVSGKFGDFGGSVAVAAVGVVGSFLSTLGATVAAVVILGRFT